MRGAVRVATLAGRAERRALGRKGKMEAGAVAPVTGADRVAQPLPVETTGQEMKTETGTRGRETSGPTAGLSPGSQRCRAGARGGQAGAPSPS